MIEWLEDSSVTAKSQPAGGDPRPILLDNVCNDILELDNNKLYRYKGNYLDLLEKKAEREAIEQTETEKARGMFRKELEWMRRMPQARTTKSKARVENFYDIQEKASKRTEKDTGSLK